MTWIWLKAFILTVSVNKGSRKREKLVGTIRTAVSFMFWHLILSTYPFRWFINCLAIKQVRLHMPETHTCTHMTRRCSINYPPKSQTSHCNIQYLKGQPALVCIALLFVLQPEKLYTISICKAYSLQVHIFDMHNNFFF